MFRNYLKIAVRNLRNGGWYSVLNIGGLAVVLAVSVLLFWWVKDELTFDRFHADSDRIYRINAHIGKGSDEQFWSSSPAPTAVAAPSQVPGVETAVRTMGIYDFRTFRINGKIFTEENRDLRYVDENFLDLFSGFPVLFGQAPEPFPTLNSVVLTEATANKFFGTINAVGKVLTVVDSNRVFTVGAVLADLPDNSTVQGKVFFPMSLRKRLFGGNGQWKRMDDDWGNFDCDTYLKLQPGIDPNIVGTKLTAIQAEARKNDGVADFGDYRLQPLTSLHLYEPSGKDTGMQQVRMLGLIALFLLSIGCINYVNLTTARATRRAREVGVRKVVGAETSQLIGQLLAESFLTMGIALVLSLLLIQILMPFYRDITGKTLGFSLLDPQAWAVLVGTLLLTLVLAGIYPALMMARFDPLKSLRGRGLSVGQAGLRQVLVVTQFALAMGLIVATLVIGSQLRHIRERDLGFNKEHTFVFWAGSKTEAYKRELAHESSILSVASSTANILDLSSQTGDTDWDGKAPNRMFIVNQMSISKEFIPANGIKLVAGRNFSGSPADSAYFILNETAIRQAGITNPIGKRFKFHETNGQIIGVVRDFHSESARKDVFPMVLNSHPNWNAMLYVRTTDAGAPKAIAAAGRLLKRDNPNGLFEYKFLDETYDRIYRAEQRTGQLFQFFAGIAIVVCCLGLFGLAAYTAEQRTKEIGVRKVLGASVVSIVTLLSKDFLKLVLIAIVIASPVAWWAMNQWLRDFSYRIDIAWWVFALSGLLAIVIALLTVSFQSIRAALMNPVKSLRSE